MQSNGKRFQEQFGDSLIRMFPDEGISIMTIGGTHVYNITMQVTEDCNMRCTYCYQHNKTKNALDFETAKKFIDILLASDERSEKYIQSRQSKGVVLDFIGGEPFLEIDLISQISDYFIEQMILLNHPWATRFRLSVCSNGLLYFEPKVQEFIRKHNQHLSLSITIDGNKDLHDSCRIDALGNGTYDRAIAAVNHYMEHYHQHSGTKVTIAPGNVDVCGNAIIGYINHNEPVINANCVYEEGWTIEHAQTLYKQLKMVANYLIDNNIANEHYISILDQDATIHREETNSWCGGSGLMIALAPGGDIYPCLRYAPSSMGNKQKLLKIGDVENGFVYNDEQAKIIEQFKSVNACLQCSSTKDCTDCPISSGCGDCAAYSYEVFGKVGCKTTFHCEMHKARSLAQVYYWNKKKPNSTPLNCPKEWAMPIIGEEEYNMLYEMSKKEE